MLTAKAKVDPLFFFGPYMATRATKAMMKPIWALVGRGMEMNLFSKVSLPSSGFGAVYIDLLYPGMFLM